MHRKSLLAVGAWTAVLVLATAPLTAAGGGSVTITMNTMTVDTATAGEATVTVNVTNDGASRIKIDLNVIALGNCGMESDPFACDVYDCTREGVGSVDGVNLDAGASGDFSVTLPLDPGDYVFRARITGSKGGSEDQKWGVQSATVL